MATKINNQNVATLVDEREGAFDFPKAETIKPTVVETRQPIVLQTTTAVRKSDLARAVFLDCYKDYHNNPASVPQRKDIIARLIKECGLTQNGAATYLQNMKTKAGLVNSKK